MPQIKSSIFEFYAKVKFFISSFIDKDLTFYAASLSFYTIFTIIPLLLIMLTLMTSLPSFSDNYEKIQGFIFSNLMPVNSDLVMEQINGFLQNSSEMGIMSFAMVIVSSLLFFQNFEYIANKIFHAQKRGIWESLTTFWTLLTLTPIALGVSFYITGYVAVLMASSELTSGINILPYIPYLIVWGLFFIIFQISANTKIVAKASMISSLITSVVFSIAKNAFIFYVFYNKSYATMYGSFSIVMFLFLWIYFSWIIFVYGLKLSYLINRAYLNKDAVKEEA
jgi:membrane protein